MSSESSSHSESSEELPMEETTVAENLLTSAPLKESDFKTVDSVVSLSDVDKAILSDFIHTASTASSYSTTTVPATDSSGRSSSRHSQRTGALKCHQNGLLELPPTQKIADDVPFNALALNALYASNNMGRAPPGFCDEVALRASHPPFMIGSHGLMAAPGKQASRGFKVHVTNLPMDTEEIDLIPLFEQFGKVKKASVLYDEDGNSIGAASVVYWTREGAEQAVQQLHGLYYVGDVNEPIQVRLVPQSTQRAVVATTRPQTGSLQGQPIVDNTFNIASPDAAFMRSYAAQLPVNGHDGTNNTASDATRKVFVGGIPFNATSEAVLGAFMAFGEVVEIVPLHKNGTPTGAIFVKYQDDESAQRLLTAGQNRAIVIGERSCPDLRVGLAKRKSGHDAGNVNAVANVIDSVLRKDSKASTNTTRETSSSPIRQAVLQNFNDTEAMETVLESSKSTSIMPLAPLHHGGSATPWTYMPITDLTALENSTTGPLTPTKLFVGCLPYSKTVFDLAEIFGVYGPVLEVALLSSPEGKSKGAAFVTFAYLRDAEKAYVSLQGFTFSNSTRAINLSFATKQTFRNEIRGLTNMNSTKESMVSAAGGATCPKSTETASQVTSKYNVNAKEFVPSSSSAMNAALALVSSSVSLGEAEKTEAIEACAK